LHGQALEGDAPPSPLWRKPVLDSATTAVTEQPSYCKTALSPCPLIPLPI